MHLKYNQYGNVYKTVTNLSKVGKFLFIFTYQLSEGPRCRCHNVSLWVCVLLQTWHSDTTCWLTTIHFIHSINYSFKFLFVVIILLTVKNKIQGVYVSSSSTFITVTRQSNYKSDHICLSQGVDSIKLN